MNTKHSYIILSLILLCGIAVRSIVLYQINQPDRLYPTMDEMNYRELAENILDTKQYATWSEGYFTQSTRAPIFPVMIASSYILSGTRSMTPVKILNAITDLFIIFLLFIIGSQLFNRKTGLITAGIYSIFGHALYFMQISNPHTFATMLLLLVCLAMVNLRVSYRWTFIPLSILYAILIHTRPVFLISLPFLLPAIYFQLSKQKASQTIKQTILCSWKTKLLKTILPIAIIAILCLPWGIRNYKLHKTLVPVCTIAGWHIASNINFDLKLSIKYLTDHFYTPDHKNFTEGEFFAMSKTMFYDSLLQYPFRIPAFGLLRLIYSWTPPKHPFYRFILPRAYICPIYITDRFFIPCPDFEGGIYLLLFATFAAFIILRKSTFTVLNYILYTGRGVLILIFGYTIVHIIGIPLISYRFLIEPILMLFGVAILAKYTMCYKNRKICETRNIEDPNTITNKREQNRLQDRKTALITLYAATLILITLIILPLCYQGTKKIYTYPNIAAGAKSYSEIRNMQWNNRGNIPENTPINVEGVVKYLHRGFHFPNDDYYAVKDANYAAARLFLKFGSKNNPLGTGDVRLNFKNGNLPKNSSPITVSGTATTGLFKEIIINVDSFSEIKQHNQQ